MGLRKKIKLILPILLIFFTILVVLSWGKKSSKKFDWRQFKGKTIVACWPNHGHYNATKSSGVIKEFEKLTGIKVEIDSLQYLKMHDKEVLEMSKRGNGDYDIISMVVMWKAEYAKAGLIEPLEPYFNKKNLQVPGYDFDDLVPSYVNVTGMAGGKNIYLDGPGAKLYGLPFGTETSFLVYRKDLFDKYKIKVPNTYDELIKAAKFFHENVPGVDGLSMRAAAAHHATHGWLLHASPYGARLLDKDTWEPAVTRPEAIQTINFIKKMVEYGPPGVTGYTQDEEWNAFLQGNAAMYLDASVFVGTARDPKRSKVADKLGFALHPKAKTRLSETGGFGLAIPTNARNKEAAFLFMMFLTMKETERKIIESGGAPFRSSTVSDKSLQSKYPEFKVLAEQLKYANPDWRPIVPEWGDISEIFGTACNQAVIGQKTPEEAMKGIVQPLRKVLIKAGYIKK